jgi:hypothetical protein
MLRVKAVLASVPVLLAAGQVMAAPFVPVVPPTCPTTTNIPWRYAVGGGIWWFDLPSDPNCSSSPGNECPHYINNIDHRRFFSANSWVGYVGFRLDFFQTEPTFDRIEWGLENSPLTTRSGTAAAGTVLWANTTASFGSRRAVLNFRTDAFGSHPGFHFNELRVCKYRTSIDTAPPPTMDLKRRHHGVLLGAGDTVYLKFSATARYHYPITLWRDAGFDDGTDYDLYTRCGALPTQTQYDARSYSGDNQEFIDAGNCTGTMYVAVNAHAANGPGAFNLARGIHGGTGHIPLRVGVTPAVSSDKLTGIGNYVKVAARYFYGYTEGEHVVTQIDIYNSGCSAGSCGGSNCDICYHSDAFGRANSGLCGGQIHVYQDTNDRVAAHELGHLKFCAGDEYYDSPGPPLTQLDQCGHTVMADPLMDNNNMCTELDHNKDGSPAATSSPLISSWGQAFAAGKAVTYSNETYDNYPYHQFDFDNRLGTVITH